MAPLKPLASKGIAATWLTAFCMLAKLSPTTGFTVSTTLIVGIGASLFL